MTFCWYLECSAMRVLPWRGEGRRKGKRGEGRREGEQMERPRRAFATVQVPLGRRNLLFDLLGSGGELGIAVFAQERFGGFHEFAFRHEALGQVIAGFDED